MRSASWLSGYPRGRPAGYWLAATALIGGCASLPENQAADCIGARGPAITYSPDGALATTRIDVLTYNIEGLPWPARKNRKPYLREIGRRLAALRAENKAPDIIVFQEVFSKAAAAAVVATGYPSIVSGPGARSRQAPNTEGPLPGGKRRTTKGEVKFNLLSSGLVLATDFPIVESNYRPYARGSCAGFDCLSNKGILYAEIAIPGVPGGIDVFTTHMNAQKASRVSEARHSEAHLRQSQELSAFAEESGTVADPTLMAGDFNMRNSDIRHYHFARRFQMTSVHQYCLEQADRCDVRIRWEHEDQWRREQDLQFYLTGESVTIRPIIAEGMFDGGPSGPVLSDHNGFRVVYELSWPTGSAAPPSCPVGPAPLAAGSW